MVYGSALKRKQRRKRNQTLGGVSDWWPLALGMAVTPVTLRLADYLTLSGPQALETLYPYALLISRHELPLSFSVREQLAHALMYLQFPLYGLLLMLTLRVRSLFSSVIQVCLIHIFGVAALYVLNHYVK